ncbi:MAG: SPASM domain-containing protein, partial [Theionarchaea archaeon]|nr:SPASM domain-containing protein [Theionarchaea archaeon]
DIFDLLEYSQDLGFSNTMATNATMIDDLVAQKLRDSGVSIAAVSLDGNKETHDSIRNRRGSFDLAVRGIRSLGNAGIPIHINITAMDMNMRQVEEVTHLSEELGASIILYYQLVPVGRGEEIGDSALTKSENRELITLISDLQKNCDAIIEPVAGPQYWSYLLNRKGLRGGPVLGLAEKVFHGCSAGRGFVYIKPDGEVLACPFVDASCGNVREQSFDSIWGKSAVLENLRNREERLKGRCGECNYRTVCGGCRGRAQAMTGDYMGEDPCCFIEEDGGDGDAA